MFNDYFFEIWVNLSSLWCCSRSVSLFDEQRLQFRKVSLFYYLTIPGSKFELILMFNKIQCLCLLVITLSNNYVFEIWLYLSLFWCWTRSVSLFDIQWLKFPKLSLFYWYPMTQISKIKFILMSNNSNFEIGTYFNAQFQVCVNS